MKTPDGELITDALLCERFPLLFMDRHVSMQATAMCWGFEIGPGWMGIMYDTAARLELLILDAITEDDDAWRLGYFRASQVKEKYGTLRFYLSGGTNEMYSIVDAAEKQSAKTCETCGKPGKVRGEGWYYTACGPCAKKRSR